MSILRQGTENAWVQGFDWEINKNDRAKECSNEDKEK